MPLFKAHKHGLVVSYLASDPAVPLLGNCPREWNWAHSKTGMQVFIAVMLAARQLETAAGVFQLGEMTGTSLPWNMTYVTKNG